MSKYTWVDVRLNCDSTAVGQTLPNATLNTRAFYE